MKHTLPEWKGRQQQQQQQAFAQQFDWQECNI
jgi:hypothetical protein